MKIKLLLAANLLAATAQAVSASTYLLTGTVNLSDNTDLYPIGTSFQVQFDYDPSLAGPDQVPEDNIYSTYLIAAFSNVAITFQGGDLAGSYDLTTTSTNFYTLYEPENFTNLIRLDLSGYEAAGFRIETISLDFTDVLTSDALPLELPTTLSGSYVMGYNEGGSTVKGTLNSIPEPSALALLGLGTVGLVARRRRVA